MSTICAAEPAVTNTEPMMNPTQYINGMDKNPSAQTVGTEISTSAMIASPATYTGSLRTRSSHTPEGSESNTKGKISIAVNKPICEGVAASKTAAVSGNASIVI